MTPSILIESEGEIIFNLPFRNSMRLVCNEAKQSILKGLALQHFTPLFFSNY